MGGSIAWNYAIASPDKVKQLILLDASGYPKKDEKGSLGFKLDENDFFLDEYAPDTWKFEPLDVTDPEKSIYAGELKVRDSMLQSATIRYESGRPDVVYRILN